MLFGSSRPVMLQLRRVAPRPPLHDAVRDHRVVIAVDQPPTALDGIATGNDGDQLARRVVPPPLLGDPVDPRRLAADASAPSPGHSSAAPRERLGA